MSEKSNNKMRVLKGFIIALLVLDVIAFVLACVNLIPSFGLFADYGEIMLVVASIITFLILAVILFEVVAKIFILRKNSSALAVFLIIFNAISAIFGFLSLGGVGATVLNQSRIWIEIFASVAEVVVAAIYLGAVKKLK